MTFVTAILKAPIRLYRLAVAPYLAPSCRFHPSCSSYALEALETHGPWKGGVLTLRRLSRCHPVSWLGGGSGLDPVPPAQPVASLVRNGSGHE